MADTQVKGKLSADGEVKGRITAPKSISSSLTADGQINGALTSEASVNGSLSAEDTLSGSLSVEPNVEGNLSANENVAGELQVKRTRTVATMLSELDDVELSNLQDDDILIYDSMDRKWHNYSGGTGTWGTITGTLSDQTDLQDALDAKISSSEKGANNGVATLDATGRVPSNQLPSFVDDVIEGYLNPSDHKFYEESTYEHEITPESSKIYVDLNTDKTYRWGGTAYAEISESIALGETQGTAYEGSKGKANADAIAKAYKTDDVTSPDLDDADTIPFYDDSASAKKKTAWSNIKAKLQAFFDVIYQAKLTFDEYPRKTSGNPVRSRGVYSSVEGTEILVDDTLGYIKKNMLSIPSGVVSTTISGITFYVDRNAEGECTGIIVSGTATSDVSFSLTGATSIEMPVGDFTFSGCPEGGSLGTFSMRVVDSYGGYLSDTGAGCSFHVDEWDLDTNYGFEIFIKNGTNMDTGTMDSYVFYPMIRKAEIISDKFFPHTNSTGTDNTKVAKAGDTMTGPLTFDKVTNAIRYTGTKATYPMIKFVDNTGDTYGNGIVIGGGGLTVIGGGESADTYAAGLSGGEESLYLTNDGNVAVVTNLQGGKASGKTFTFGNDGTFNSPSTIKQNGTAVSLSGHTHNYAGSSSAGGKANSAARADIATAAYAVKDSSSAADTTFSYYKAAMGYDNYTYLAGWNGYELRAVAKTQFQVNLGLQLVFNGSLVAGASKAIGSYGAHTIFILAFGTWNVSQLIAVFPNNSSTPVSRLIAGYSTSFQYINITANGQWGITIKNTSSVNMPLMIFAIPKTI